MTGYTTRAVQIGDAEAIRTIYNREVLASTVTFDMVERTPEEQLSWITDHSGSYPAIVAVDDHDVVMGFASLTPYRPRPAYATTVENSVYVRHDQRGHGIGSLLMHNLVTIASEHGFHSIIARIVGNHTSSIALHTNLGFSEIGREIEVGRKFGTWLDVVLMQKML